MKGSPTRKAVLHIGTEKTGTTTLQLFLAANKARLLDQGVLFPTRAAHHNVVYSVCAPHRRGWAMDAAKVNAYRRQLAAEIETQPPERTILLSSEVMHSRLTTDEDLARLRRYLAKLGLEVADIVVYFRDQCSLIESSFTERVRAGQVRPFQWDIFRLEDAYFRHESTAKAWAGSFPDAKLHVGSYNRERADICGHFLQTLGLSGEGFDPPKSFNPSPSPKILEVVRQAKLRDPGIDAERLCEVLFPVDPFERHGMLTAEEIAAIEAEFGPSNRRMCEAFGLDPADFPACADPTPGRPPEVGADELTAVVGALSGPRPGA